MTTPWNPVQTRPWKELYVAALMETDPNIALERISEAERVIVERARELFHALGDDVEEGEALDDALYYLHVLKNCLTVRGRRAVMAPPMADNSSPVLPGPVES
jgi:hypothetical protein